MHLRPLHTQTSTQAAGCNTQRSQLNILQVALQSYYEPPVSSPSPAQSVYCAAASALSMRASMSAAQDGTRVPGP